MCVLHQGAINKIIPLLIMGTFSCLGGIVSTAISCWCYNDSFKNTFLPTNSSRPPCFCQRPYSSTCPTPWRRGKRLGPNSTFSAAPPIQGRTRILFWKRQTKLQELRGTWPRTWTWRGEDLSATRQPQFSQWSIKPSQSWISNGIGHYQSTSRLINTYRLQLNLQKLTYFLIFFVKHTTYY